MADDTTTDTSTTGPATEPVSPEQQPAPETETKPTDIPREVQTALRKANKEAETLRLKLKEYEDRDKTEQQRLDERATAAEQRATQLEADLIRHQVAVEKGLTPNQAKRLVGATREELEADATELLTDIAGRPKPSFDGGARTSVTASTPSEAFADFLNKQLGH